MSPEPFRPAPKPQAAARILGLDGLRAFAVLAVLLFHAPFEWMRGGFLGVEVFFVISGFLITGLLVVDYDRHGRIDLGRFWQRRLRRLLPALVTFLAVVSTVGACFLGARASQFRVDLPMSMVYMENWYQIHSGNSYFADQGWPLLRHLWSLAVEGQFYLVWPFLVAGAAWCFKGRTWPLMLLSALLAAGSFGLMVRLADPGNLSSLKAMASLNRAYLGTDTRAFGLLAGALLALILKRRPEGRAASGAPAWTLDLGAVLALAGLGFLMARTSTQDPFLYRGGLLVVDGLTLVVIAALVLPSTRLVRAILGLAPLEWIGQRSYGLYLWHWPVFRLLAPGRTDPLWFSAKVLVAVGLTAACYRWIEAPIRRDGFRRWLAALSGTRVRKGALRLATATLIAAMAWETKALAGRTAYLDPVAESIRAGAVALDNAAPQPMASPAPPAATPDPAGPGKAAQARHMVETPINPIAMPESMKGVRLTAIGDSVMKGAAIPLKKVGEASLGAGMIQINAEECRSFSAGVAILRTYKEENRLGEVVVIHLGTNNSSIPPDQFRQLMGLLADRRSVIFLTAKSDKVQACQSVNQALEGLAAGRPNVRVLDWQTAAQAHPEYFYPDQTHLRPEGARRYAELILNQVALPAQPEPPGRVN